MVYNNMRRFIIFLLFACGRVFFGSVETAAMDYDSGEEDFGGSNGAGNMKTQVRSIVDNILQLNQSDGRFDNRRDSQDNDDNRNGRDGSSSYDGDSSQRQRNDDENQYGENNDGERRRYDDETSSYGDNDRYNSGNNRKQRSDDDNYPNDDERAVANNREVNRRIDKTIDELNNLKKDVNKNFADQQQRHSKDVKNEKQKGEKIKKNEQKKSRKKKVRKAKKCNKRIFTVKNIDTCNIYANSYLNKIFLKVKNTNYADADRQYVIKTYPSEKDRRVAYVIKSYAASNQKKDRLTKSAGVNNAKYTIKNSTYFTHKFGCAEAKCE